jgi:hypothetical protein
VQSGESQRGGAVAAAKFGRMLFESLWRLDFLAMGLEAMSRPSGPRAESKTT